MDLEQERYLKAVKTINDREAARTKPLEEQLGKLKEQVESVRMQKAIQAAKAREPGKVALIPTASDLLVAGNSREVQAIEKQMADVAKELNSIYQSWILSLRLLPPPAGTSKPKDDWSSKIPFPAFVPRGVRDYITRCIAQKGLAVTDRVTLKKGPGTVGIAIEYKW